MGLLAGPIFNKNQNLFNKADSGHLEAPLGYLARPETPWSA